MNNDISCTQLASRSDNTERSIKSNIRRNLDFLKTIGKVKTEIVNDHEAGQHEKVYWLNVFQAWYVVSTFKNTPKNRQLKMDLTESVSRNADIHGAWKGEVKAARED